MLLALLACTPKDTLVVTADGVPLDDFVSFLGDPRVTLADDPGRAPHIDVRVQDGCAGCYTAEADGDDAVVVTGGDVLGAQYGLADVLERMGYGFFHPYDPEIPDTLALPDALPDGEVSPAIARRGLHLHTLHPIEGLDACYIPNDTDECRRVLDWLVKNRGNYVQWPALDDVLTDDGEWTSFTTDIVERAHERGLETGIGIQLFGSSNLQQAFDLVDSVGSADAMQASMDQRLSTLAPIPWDMVSLSFGEFSGQEPQTFIDTTNLAYDRIQAALPGVAVNAVIHVGNSEALRVTYDGQEMLYYFLVQFANPAIEPWVHTVMYYDLEEDAGGAYFHDDFSEHRAFLEARLNAGEPVGYFPETAYWVAFDNPVPMYLPLYMRSRSLDLQTYPTLPSHTIFSSGWEWGYWQNDVASLRMSYSGETWQDAVGEMFDADTASVVEQLADLQHDALIDQRLAAYVAGRDALIEAGDAVGIIGQPDRVTFDELYASDADTRAAFRTDVVDPLTTFAAAIDALPRPSGDRWRDEVADGVDIDALRAAYVAALNRAVLASADGQDPTSDLDEADALLDRARDVVSRRGSHFHDPNGDRWAAMSWDNPTVYDYGYLREAQSVCFWERERAEVRNLLLDAGETVRACVL